MDDNFPEPSSGSPFAPPDMRSIPRVLLIWPVVAIGLAVGLIGLISLVLLSFQLFHRDEFTSGYFVRSTYGKLHVFGHFVRGVGGVLVAHAAFQYRRALLILKHTSANSVAIVDFSAIHNRFWRTAGLCLAAVAIYTLVFTGYTMFLMRP